MKRTFFIIVGAAAVVYGANGYVSTSKISVSGCGNSGQALESNGDCTYQWATVATPDPLTISSETVTGTLYFGTALQSTGLGNNNQAGSARGLAAVDLQTYRNTANQVASGDESVIGGGLFNRASGQASTIAGGWQGQALGTYDAVGGGTGNIGFGSAATVAGGDTNSAHNNYASIMGGQNNTGNGLYDSILGGLGCTLSGDNSLCYSTMTITVSGSNVAVFKGVKMGIDVSAPTEQLEVNGNVKLANNLVITSAPSAAGILGISSANTVYVSTGTGAGAWVKVGSQ